MGLEGKNSKMFLGDGTMGDIFFAFLSLLLLPRDIQNWETLLKNNMRASVVEQWRVWAFASTRLGFKSQLYLFYSLVSSFTFLILNDLNHKIWVIIPTWQGFCEN